MILRLIPIEDLQKLLRYEPHTGKLYWYRREVGGPGVGRLNPSKLKTWNTRYAGKEAFAAVHPCGYWSGRIFGRAFLAHRVAFALFHGRWPCREIDHIDHNRANNRICNLREVSRREQTRNSSMRSDNTSGVNGVTARPGGHFDAHMGVAGKHLHLGRFSTLEDAQKARKEAESRFGFHANHGITP